LDSNGLPYYAYPGFISKLSATFNETYHGTSTLFASSTDSPPALQNDSLAYFTSEDGYLFAFDTSSTSAKWAAAVKDSNNNVMAITVSPTVGQRKVGATITNQIYIGADDKKVHAYNDSGTEQWNYTAGDLVETSSALDCRGVLYFGTNNGHVIALVTDSDGLAASSWPKYQHDNKNSGNLSSAIYVGGTCQD
jgi:hypothetical protein